MEVLEHDTVGRALLKSGDLDSAALQQGSFHRWLSSFRASVFASLK